MISMHTNMYLTLLDCSLNGLLKCTFFSVNVFSTNVLSGGHYFSHLQLERGQPIIYVVIYAMQIKV